MENNTMKVENEEEYLSHDEVRYSSLQNCAFITKMNSENDYTVKYGVLNHEIKPSNVMEESISAMKFNDNHGTVSSNDSHQDPVKKSLIDNNGVCSDNVLPQTATETCLYNIKVKQEMKEEESHKEKKSSMLDSEYLMNSIDHGHSIFGDSYSPDISLLTRLGAEKGIITEENCSKELINKNYPKGFDKETDLASIQSICERCHFKENDPRHIDCFIVMQQGDKPYSCLACKKAFKVKNKLVTHIRIHIGDKPFSCNVCGKSFRVKNKLNVHTRIHTNIRPYVCHICNKGFFEGHGLNYHLTTHTEDKAFPCDVCEKSFTYSSGLQRHMKIHTGDRPYSCNVCEKTFMQKCNLERHLRVHSGEKPYHCHVCKKNFVESGHLQIHLRIHSGEKPFVCDVCDKRFTIKNGLQRHMRIHTGDRPYSCSLCNKSFNEKSNFLKHTRICDKKPHNRKLLKFKPDIIYLPKPKEKV